MSGMNSKNQINGTNNDDQAGKGNEYKYVQNTHSVSDNAAEYAVKQLTVSAPMPESEINKAELLAFDIYRLARRRKN